MTTNPQTGARPRVVVTGAQGLIGRRLVASLDAEVTVLSRNPTSARRVLDAARFVEWDGRSAIDPAVFEGAQTVYHLAGEPVAEGRWTAEKKRRIEESRVFGTRAVADAILAAGGTASLVSASAVGFYASRGDEVLTETSAPGEGFLADVCCAWEAEASRVADAGGRATTLRIGIVLARDGGALARMLPIFRTGVAGRLGDGKQWMSWIHVDDVVALFLRAGEVGKDGAPALDGPVNATAPAPVTNAEFTQTLARVLGRPAFLPAPAFALRLALGQMADVVLASQRVLPEKALAAGFTFRHRTLEGALEDLLAPAPQARGAAA